MKIQMMMTLLAASMANVACQQPTEIIEVRDSTIYCMLDDCSEWTEETAETLLDEYQARWDVLFPEEEFKVAKNWYVEKEEDLACRMLPDTPFTQPDCGGYSGGGDIHMQGTLSGFTLSIYMAQTSHELTHNTLAHTKGDGDRNHSEAGGPWTGEHDRLVNVMNRLGCDGWEEFGTPCGE